MTTGPLDRGRAYSGQPTWGETYETLAAANDDEPLGLDDLEDLGLAAYMIGFDDAATDAWTRAHLEAIRCSDPERAARNALLIGSVQLFRGELAPASGWFARGGRVLEGRGATAEHVWILTWNAYSRMFTGDPEGAEPAFAEAVEVARSFDDVDLSTMSRLGLGMCLVMLGDPAAGISMLDEVMVGVTSGEVSPIFAGIAYCSVLASCSDVFDLRRAREWTSALTRWCDAQPGLVPFRGNCLVHQCEILQLQGSWSQAVEAAEHACDYLSGPVKWDSLGSAYYQLGELQRLRGEQDLAVQSYLRASEAGRQPEPGLALLRLAQGRVDVAVAAIRRVIDEGGDPSARSRLLPAYVEITLAAGDVPAARAGAEELAKIAEQLDAPYLQAVAAASAAAVLLADGDARSALANLRLAAAVWLELDVPHETARVKVLTGLACRALGDTDTAEMELDGARAMFTTLGAGPDLERLDALIAQYHGRAVGGLSAREVEVLKLIGSGQTNRGIANQLGLSEKTIARHVSNIFTKIDVPSRAAATAYAYEHGLM